MWTKNNQHKWWLCAKWMCQEESTKTGKTIGLLGPLHKISYYCRTPLPCQKRCTKRKLKETKGPHHGKSKLCISPLQGSSANKVAKERSSWRRLLFKYASDYSPFLKHPSVAVTHLLWGHLSFSSIGWLGTLLGSHVSFSLRTTIHMSIQFCMQVALSRNGPMQQ